MARAGGLPLDMATQSARPCKPCESLLLRHAGLGKTRHPRMTFQRRADDVDGEAGAGAFAEPHAEVEQRRQAERFEQAAVAGFGRDMGGDGVGEA